MNIYCINPQYVKPSSWPYLIKVLKIGKVFSFIKKENIQESAKFFESLRCLYIVQGESKPDFIKRCVFNMANVIKQNTSQGYMDLVRYIESNYLRPKQNLLQTDDENILILGDIYYNEFPNWFYFEEDDSCYGHANDTATEIVRFLFNILKKQLGHNHYAERICMVIIDTLTLNNYIYSYKRNGWIDVSSKTKFIKLFNHLIYKKYPIEFPLIEENGKKKYTSLLNGELRQIDLKRMKEEKRREDEEEEMRIRSEEEAQKWKDDVEQMNRDFYDEIGECSVNID